MECNGILRAIDKNNWKRLAHRINPMALGKGRQKKNHGILRPEGTNKNYPKDL